MKTRSENPSNRIRGQKRELGPSAPRGGFTLLEVIVAVALTTLIIGVIGGAIRLYFISLRQAQTNMELTELARNTLNMVTSDLRSAIQYKPVDVSGLQELLDSQASAIAGPSLSDSSTDQSGSTGGQNSGDQSSGNQSNSTTNSGNQNNGSQSAGETSGQSGSSATQTAGANGSSAANASGTAEEPPKDRPKFIGSRKAVVVDVSRLPRLDQYDPILHLNSNGQYTSLPTDIKSISYFVSFDSGDASSGGLYRREVDRATRIDGSEGGLYSIDAAAREVAAEVVDVSFRYFDGENWQEEWNSDDAGGYPSAVEVTIVIDPARSHSARRGKYQLSDADPKSLRTFRNVTKLPLAELLSEEEQELIANPTQFSSPSSTNNTTGGNQ